MPPRVFNVIKASAAYLSTPRRESSLCVCVCVCHSEELLDDPGERIKLGLQEESDEGEEGEEGDEQKKKLKKKLAVSDTHTDTHTHTHAHAHTHTRLGGES